MKNFRLQAKSTLLLGLPLGQSTTKLCQFQIIIIMMLLRHFSIPRMEHQLVLQVVNQELNIGRIELIMF
jgi:hypothetical protein